ncbi:MAG: TetR/AcrR family transcriptional regulator [Actinomycetales bacterium]
MAHVSVRRARTRDRLLDAAISAFAERGVLGSSVEELCERAGFTRGAFYSNFATKDDLCIALIERQCQVQVGRVDVVLDEVAGAGQVELRQLLEQAVTGFLEIQGYDLETALAMAELRLYVARNPRLAPGFRALDAVIRQQFAAVITDSMARFGYRFVLPVDDVVQLLEAMFEQYWLASADGQGPGTHAVRDDVTADLIRRLVGLLSALMVQV